MKRIVWMMTMVALGGGAFAARPPQAPPDLTRSNTVDRTLTYNLGATGMRGWIYTHPSNYLDSVQGRTTAASRQILVTHVGAGSPADGVMRVDDVILGVDGRPFESDARQALGRAITQAESPAGRGELNLLRYRDGATASVRLPMEVLGAYSDTAPYDCPKSRRILARAAEVLAKEEIRGDLWGAVQCLALLAAGNSNDLPRVRTFARAIAPPVAARGGPPGLSAWEWGYKGLFLGEYFLATDDREVLPEIREIAVALARGQSMYGTYGHGMSEPTAAGDLHGSIAPYGALNQAGLIANLAIVMGRKCGVKDPEVDDAIWRATRFFRYFVGKGSIPYGEHMPWPYHENNGKNALSAVLFALEGSQPEAARYFAKMSVAGFANREYGHTGQGFSYLWGAMGANAGGPAAAAAFLKEARWHLDLVRRCDGSFTYDGGEQYGPGKTEDGTYHGNSSYYGLSPNATYVLTYALPLKRLFITGREANPAHALAAKDVAEAVASGRFDVDRGTKGVEDLVVALGDWSPVVRSWAAEELARRPEAKAMTSRLIGLAEGGSANVRQGACETLGYLKDTNALPVLVRLLTHEDRWLRVKAAGALKNLGGAARPVAPGMLKALVHTAEPASPIVWEDPVQLTHGELAEALFGGLLRDSLAGIDRGLLYPAIRAVAGNADGMARGRLHRAFADLLTLEDVEALGPDILAAVMTKAPADTMFCNDIRMAALQALVKYRFREGIAACVHFARTQGGHGSQNRTGEIMKLLLTYGAAAAEAIPHLNELIAEFDDQCKRGRFPAGELNDRRVGDVRAAIASIEAARERPELRSIAAAASPRAGGPKQGGR